MGVAAAASASALRSGSALLLRSGSWGVLGLAIRSNDEVGDGVGCGIGGGSAVISLLTSVSALGAGLGPGSGSEWKSATRSVIVSTLWFDQRWGRARSRARDWRP